MDAGTCAEDGSAVGLLICIYLTLYAGTVAEGAPIIPISAQLKYNIEVICEYICKKIPIPLRDFTSKPRLIGECHSLLATSSEKLNLVQVPMSVQSQSLFIPADPFFVMKSLSLKFRHSKISTNLSLISFVILTITCSLSFAKLCKWYIYG